MRHISLHCHIVLSSAAPKEGTCSAIPPVSLITVFFTAIILGFYRCVRRRGWCQNIARANGSTSGCSHPFITGTLRSSHSSWHSAPPQAHCRILCITLPTNRCPSIVKSNSVRFSPLLSGLPWQPSWRCKPSCCLPLPQPHPLLVHTCAPNYQHEVVWCSPLSSEAASVSFLCLLLSALLDFVVHPPSFAPDRRIRSLLLLPPHPLSIQKRAADYQWDVVWC